MNTKSKSKYSSLNCQAFVSSSMLIGLSVFILTGASLFLCFDSGILNCGCTKDVSSTLNANCPGGDNSKAVDCAKNKCLVEDCTSLSRSENESASPQVLAQASTEAAPDLTATAAAQVASSPIEKLSSEHSHPRVNGSPSLLGAPLPGEHEAEKKFINESPKASGAADSTSSRSDTVFAFEDDKSELAFLRVQSNRKSGGRGSEASLKQLEARTSLAVKRGLRFLQKTQNKNGSWVEKIGRKVQHSYEGNIDEHVGVTALAAMAFLASGSSPTRGPYQKEIAKGLDFVLKNVAPNGFISANESRMYSHAFATLFMAEVYGMTGSDKVGKKLRACVALIVDSQNAEGGWRYLPGAEDADMSISVCQVMALRAAKNAGIFVSKTVIDKAINYVKTSFSAGYGGFNYQHPIGQDGSRRMTRVTFPLTAAGVTALYGAGHYKGAEVRKGLQYLRRNYFSRSYARGSFDYYYGMYYATQAFFQAGGEKWAYWYKTIWPDILSLQDRRGAWRDLVGSNYATAMACVILQIPFQYLPIFER